MILLVALAGVGFWAPPPSAPAPEIQISPHAKRQGLAYFEAEYGRVDRVVSERPTVKNGRWMYEVRVEGRFVVVGPLSPFERTPPRIRFDEGRIAFDENGFPAEIAVRHSL